MRKSRSSAVDDAILTPLDAYDLHVAHLLTRQNAS